MPFRARIAQAVAPALQVQPEDVLNLLETPPSADLGDYALPCFSFAKTMRKAPQLIAQDVVACPMPDCVEKAVVVGGYANFFVKRSAFARTVLQRVREQGERYGAVDLGHGQAVRCV